jgi:hypothetical protein
MTDLQNAATEAKARRDLIRKELRNLLERMIDLPEEAKGLLRADKVAADELRAAEAALQKEQADLLTHHTERNYNSEAA